MSVNNGRGNFCAAIRAEFRQTTLTQRIGMAASLLGIPVAFSGIVLQAEQIVAWSGITSTMFLIGFVMLIGGVFMESCGEGDMYLE